MTRLLLLNGNTDPAITALLLRTAGAALPRLGLAGVALVPATARFGARYVAGRAAAAVAGHAVLEAVAERAGPGSGIDAVALACFGDPGLAAAAEVASVPVVGMAAASLDAALAAAGRAAILTGGAAWVPMLEELLRARGEAGRVTVHALPADGGAVARDPAAALPGLEAAARAGLAAGAGAVVLGGAGLAGLAPALAARLPAGVALLDSLDCLLAAAVAAARAGPPAGRVAAAVPTVGLSPGLAARMGEGG